jgi:hypothetical protein
VSTSTLFADTADTKYKSPSPSPAGDKLIALVDRGAQDALSRYDPDEIKLAWGKVDLHIMLIVVLLYCRLTSTGLFLLINHLNYWSIEQHHGKRKCSLSIQGAAFDLQAIHHYTSSSNIILKRIGPRWYIPVMAVRLVRLQVSCLADVCHADHPGGCLFLVLPSAHLYWPRLFLGVAEGGFIPGIIYWSSSQILTLSSSNESFNYSGLMVSAPGAGPTLCSAVLFCPSGPYYFRLV